MSDVIRPGSTIGGVPVEGVMSMMGKALSFGRRKELTKDEMSFLVDMGLVERRSSSGFDTFSRTPSGKALANARIGERMSLDYAMWILDTVLENASSPIIAARIGPSRIRVFGSVMRGDPAPADLDLMVCAPGVSTGWVCSSYRKEMFGNIPDSEIFLKDAHISPDEDLWCDTAVVWEDGKRLSEWRFEQADPEARSRFLKEAEVFGEIPLDDPSFLVLPDQPYEDPEPFF